MKSLRITKTWIVLLVYLLAGMTGTESLVLCLSTQGHVGIEVAGLNQSCDGPCVDIPILTGSSGQQSQQLRPSEDFSRDFSSSHQDHHAALITFASAPNFSAETPEKNLLSFTHSTIGSTITSLRTVISFLV